MPNHYDTLGLTQDATPQAIVSAYRRLALIHHPDRRGGTIARFQAIQEAYGVLSDRDKRWSYDHAGQFIPAAESSFARYRREGLHFFVPEHPERLNYYEYYNAIFELEGAARIRPGMVLDWRELDERVRYVAETLIYERLVLIYDHPGRLTEAERQRLALINKQFDSKKMYWLQKVLLSSDDYSDDRRHAYNIYLGHCPTDEDREILHEIGGSEAIGAAMKKDPYMEFSSAMFTLHRTYLLTPGNFRKITYYKHCASNVGLALDNLQAGNLATQANLDFLVRHMNTSGKARHIFCGIACLSEGGILNQKNLTLVVQGGDRGDFVGGTLQALHSFGLSNPENERVAAHRIPSILSVEYFNFPLSSWTQDSAFHPASSSTLLHDRLLAMRNASELPPEQTANLHWDDPEKLGDLGSRINEMFAHGLFLLCGTHQLKGKEIMRLALELKSDLRAFMQRPVEQQVAGKEVFRRGFILKLHSKDDNMSVHRSSWKMIVANISLALTGIGLFAIGVNYLLTGQSFFARTKCNKLIDGVEKSNWLKVM